MKTEIKIWNGGGWNNYSALKSLKTLPVGTRGLMTANGIQSIEISPRDSERPYGIAARYYDADGELIFTHAFDQNDSAGWIRDRVFALLTEGIQTRINARAREISREAFIKRVTAWRSNFPNCNTPPSATKSANTLRAKIGALRAATGKHSRKECWTMTYAVIAGAMTYRDAIAKFGVDSARATQIWNAAQASHNK